MSHRTIPPNTFYSRTTFVPPALAPSKAQFAALSAARNDPARTFRTFPVQQAAFDFCDARPGHALRVWATEKDGNGRRSFIAASYDAFWRVYARYIRRGLEMHFYEVIREGFACKLYFDLEFQRRWNGDKSGEDMVEVLVGVVGELVGRRICRGDAGEVIELDSTSERKFSRHVVFEGVGFYDNIGAGEFARRVVERVMEKDAGMMLVRKGAGEAESVPFVDMGVYTKNRCFRLVGSSKFGKKERLLPVGGKDHGRVCVSKVLFLRSLVCWVGKEVGLIGWVSGMGGKRGKPVERASGVCVKKVGESSPYAKVDEYVYSIIGRDGGGIYGVSMLSSTETLMYAIKGGYKYCGNVGRHHKSNNVILVADLRKGEMYQKCFDPDCRGYRSEAWEMPEGVCGVEGQGEYIDESLDDECLVEMADLVDRMEGCGDESLGDRCFVERADYDGGIDDEALNALMDVLEGANRAVDVGA